ncbi:hypothetical protein HAX54_031263 [Datura stramonium]|uniref:Uncharacterized protein n=1 Tax=Datura stramonium TaxID=4076 RepID=A0ABS8VC39_DATST|nr:hypothetical protein [Datura stramonium]
MSPEKKRSSTRKEKVQNYYSLTHRWVKAVDLQAGSFKVGESHDQHMEGLNGFFSRLGLLSKPSSEASSRKKLGPDLAGQVIFNDINQQNHGDIRDVCLMEEQERCIQEQGIEGIQTRNSTGPMQDNFIRNSTGPMQDNFIRNSTGPMQDNFIRNSTGCMQDDFTL